MPEMDPMTLFTPEGTPTVPHAPAIVGIRCNDCNAVAFPFQPFGCENCGSVDVAQSRLDGRGRVLTTARVHIHADPNRPPPFTIAAVLLDCGAFVRGVVADESADHLEFGDTVVTSLVPEFRPNRGKTDIRFVKQEVN